MTCLQKYCFNRANFYRKSANRLCCDISAIANAAKIKQEISMKKKAIKFKI